METEVGVEGNDEGKFQKGGIEKSSCSFHSVKGIANPVVYKLVRVEGDGRLVPATDEEVMEVEGLLAGNKSELHIVADTGQTLGCITNEESFPGMPPLESSEGLLQPVVTKVYPDKLNAQLEYIEEMLQKVKEEERLRLACGYPDYSSAYVIVDSQCSERYDKLPCIDKKFQSEIALQENAPLLAPILSENQVNQSGTVDHSSDRPVEPIGASSSTDGTTFQPDFSTLKGEICLDNLSIKELHETFKATFGRETTVKDKQWLKRRIVMGLTNSCDVTPTAFVIKDDKVIPKGEELIYNNLENTFAKDPTTGAINVDNKDSPTRHGSLLEGSHAVSEKRNRSTGDNSGSEDHHTDQRASKRVRKPTRRYIEELSEVESKEEELGGKLKTSSKNSELGHMFTKSHVRAVRSISSDGRTIITRLDSLGGSGIEVPCVSRVRRSRPRKNFMALLKFNPGGTGMTATLVKKAVSMHNFQLDDESANKVIKTNSEQSQRSFMGQVDEDDEQFSTVDAIAVKHNVELKRCNSSENSDDDIVTVPTSKGGIRRKHHRAWTLSEVVKLVDGVDRYGAGRWSEIKRLAFASYSYRTSVDLKDKWRNLLKASFAQVPPDKGVNPRKNTASIPIPAPILSKVRKLAEMQAQVPPSHSSTKVAGTAGNSVQENQSGFL